MQSEICTLFKEKIHIVIDPQSERLRPVSKVLGGRTYQAIRQNDIVMVFSKDLKSPVEVLVAYASRLLSLSDLNRLSAIKSDQMTVFPSAHRTQILLNRIWAEAKWARTKEAFITGVLPSGDAWDGINTTQILSRKCYMRNVLFNVGTSLGFQYLETLIDGLVRLPILDHVMSHMSDIKSNKDKFNIAAGLSSDTSDRLATTYELAIVLISVDGVVTRQSITTPFTDLDRDMVDWVFFLGYRIDLDSIDMIPILTNAWAITKVDDQISASEIIHQGEEATQ